MEAVGGLAEALTTYGGWGVSALLVVAVGFLFKAYNDTQNKRVADQQANAEKYLEQAAENLVTLKDLAALMTAMTESMNRQAADFSGSVREQHEQTRGHISTRVKELELTLQLKKDG